MSSAVEQLAGQIGLKNYQDYTLFEARKVLFKRPIVSVLYSTSSSNEQAICTLSSGDRDLSEVPLHPAGILNTCRQQCRELLLSFSTHLCTPWAMV